MQTLINLPYHYLYMTLFTLSGGELTLNSAIDPIIEKNITPFNLTLKIRTIARLVKDRIETQPEKYG